MKKKILSLLMTAAILISLVSAMAVPAFADTKNFRGTEGSEVSWLVAEGVVNYDDAGDLPAGVSIRFSNSGRLLIAGVPSEAGTFHCAITAEIMLPPEEPAEPEEGEETPDVEPVERTETVTFSVNIEVEPAAKSDYTLAKFTAAATVGESKKYAFDMDVQGSITESKIEGKLPDGMKGNVTSSAITVEGKPTKAGVYSFTLKAYDSEQKCWISQPCDITIKAVEKPVITKDPTSESLEEGGTALFVARADGATKITWFFISSDGQKQFPASEAAGNFSGLRVTGHDEEVLRLERVPYSMNGWGAYAEFENSGGKATSEIAKLKVAKFKVKSPSIRVQPEGADLKPGEKTNLTISAVSPDENTVNYQWYKNTTKSTTGGTPISGATSATYTAKYQEGTVYYYCEARCVKGNESSDTVKSICVAVNGIIPEMTKPTEETTAPTEATTAPTEETTAPTVPLIIPEKTPRKNYTLLFVAAAVMIVALICITILLIRFGLPNFRDDDDFHPRANRNSGPKAPAPKSGKFSRPEETEEDPDEPEFDEVYEEKGSLADKVRHLFDVDDD